MTDGTFALGLAMGSAQSCGGDISTTGMWVFAAVFAVVVFGGAFALIRNF